MFNPMSTNHSGKHFHPRGFPLGTLFGHGGQQPFLITSSTRGFPHKELTFTIHIWVLDLTLVTLLSQ